MAKYVIHNAAYPAECVTIFHTLVGHIWRPLAAGCCVIRLLFILPNKWFNQRTRQFLPGKYRWRL